MQGTSVQDSLQASTLQSSLSTAPTTVPPRPNWNQQELENAKYTKLKSMVECYHELDRKNGVKYLNHQERQMFKLDFDEQGRVVDSLGAPRTFGYDKDMNPTRKAPIFVMDPFGDIYAAFDEFGKFHHSSFLGARPVAAAGTLRIMKGEVQDLTDHSGHYHPREEHMEQIIDELYERKPSDGGL